MNPIINNNSPPDVKNNPKGNISSIVTPSLLILAPYVQTKYNDFKIVVGGEKLAMSKQKHHIIVNKFPSHLIDFKSQRLPCLLES